MAVSVPKKIKVGLEEYSVLITDDLPDDDNGYFWRNKGVIRIRSGLPAYFEKTIVLHEALHAVMDRSGLNHRFNDSEEEEVVHILGEYLTDFLRSNPDLVKYILAK